MFSFRSFKLQLQRKITIISCKMEILTRFCSAKRKKPGNLCQKHVQSLQVSGSSSDRQKDCLEASRTPALGRRLQPPCEKAALWHCAAPQPQLPPARASPRAFPSKAFGHPGWPRPSGDTSLAPKQTPSLASPASSFPLKCNRLPSLTPLVCQESLRRAKQFLLASSSGKAGLD